MIDKDLAQILSFLGEVSKKAIERLKDGFQPLPDIMAMIPSLMGGQEAYEGNENAWNYLATLTDEKMNETVAAIMAELKEVEPKKQEFIKRILLTLANGYMTFLAGKALNEGEATA